MTLLVMVHPTNSYLYLSAIDIFSQVNKEGKVPSINRRHLTDLL